MLPAVTAYVADVAESGLRYLMCNQACRKAPWVRIPPSAKTFMQPIKPKWSQSGLVLVCERCTKERIPEEDPDKAAEIGDFHLRDWLKERLKADGLWGKVRAINTSCMDVCVRRHVTLVIDPKVEGKDAQAFIVDPVADREAVYAEIVKRLG